MSGSGNNRSTIINDPHSGNPGVERREPVQGSTLPGEFLRRPFGNRFQVPEEIIRLVNRDLADTFFVVCHNLLEKAEFHSEKYSDRTQEKDGYKEENGVSGCGGSGHNIPSLSANQAQFNHR
ncbi:hypothetical protein [Thermodesulfitimonas sp.]